MFFPFKLLPLLPQTRAHSSHTFRTPLDGSLALPQLFRVSSVTVPAMYFSCTDIAVIVAALGGMVFRLWRQSRMKYKLPPGPAGIPFFGNLFQLSPLRSHPQVSASLLTTCTQFPTFFSVYYGHRSTAPSFTCGWDLKM